MYSFCLLWQADRVLKKHREARLKDMISLRRAISIFQIENGTYPAVPLKLHSVSRCTPQALSKPYAFTQQSRMGSTRIRQTPEPFFPSALGLQIIGTLQAASTDGFVFRRRILCVKHLPILSPSTLLYGILYHIVLVFVNMIVEFFADFSGFLTAYFSGSCRKSSWAAHRGRQSHADIYTVRYAT